MASSSPLLGYLNASPYTDPITEQGVFRCDGRRSLKDISGYEGQECTGRATFQTPEQTGLNYMNIDLVRRREMNVEKRSRRMIYSEIDFASKMRTVEPGLRFRLQPK